MVACACILPFKNVCDDVVDVSCVVVMNPVVPVVLCVSVDVLVPLVPRNAG